MNFILECERKSGKAYKEIWHQKFGYFWCQICKKSDGGIYDCEHIMSKGRFPKHKELENCLNKILVCRECHENKNTEAKSEFEKIKRERGLYNLFKHAI